AIYGFNGADDQIMMEFRAAADRTFPLVTNRRSVREIVHAAHEILKTQGVVASDEAPLDAARGSLGEPTIFLRTSDDEVGLTAARVADEAAAIADEIARLLADGTPHGEIAILLRKRTHMQRYVHALAQRGIPVAADRRAGLLDLPEIRDARAWLHVLVHLDDLPRLVRLLQSPQIGASDAELAALAPLTVERVLDEPTDDARLLALRAMLESLLAARTEAAPLAVKRLFATVPIAASYAADVDAEQRLSNLRAFEALAQRFAADGDDESLAAFVEYLETSVSHDELLDEAEVDAHGVSVLTVHQAKGLEWPVVFAAGADKSSYGHRRMYVPLTRDARNGALVFARDVDDRKTLRSYMRKETYDPATGERRDDAEKHDAEREAARLFYVALTRARDRLYVSAASTKNAYAGLGALAAHAHPWPEPSPESAAPAQAAPPVPSRVRETQAASPAPAAIAPPRVSFTALATYERCPRRARLCYRLKFPDLRAEMRAAGGDDRAPRTDAATFGSLVHRALELWAQARIDGEPITPDAALAAACSEFAGLRSEDRTRAAAYVANALAALGDWEPLAAETEFTHRVGDAELYGVIDLLARDADGTVHVIDYKTGTLVGDEHYALQLELYARAARERFPGAEVRARLLRIGAEGAEFRDAAPLAPD
ncbi:MAG: PD-(D/E)XK nuclease family protein, partial [bacterium]|nr:PD-(D/E)XK nuclease family protein [bacterium]